MKCRPPNNRAPHPSKLETCKRLWLDRQIELIDPTIVVLLGKIPITQVLNEPSHVKESHGQMVKRNGRWYQIQYHPSAGRRFPEIRVNMRRDMAKLKRFLDTRFMTLNFLGTRGYIDLRTSRHGMHTATMVSWRGKRVMLDCGEDWLTHLTALKPDAIVVTHPHPDHVGGLKQGSLCPVYAIEAAWEKMAGFPIEPAHRHTLRIRRPASIGNLIFEPFSVLHSVQAPAVGYRITAGNLSIFYVPDVVRIPDRSEAFAGIRTYIGDGATMTRPLIRKEKQTHQLIGHTTIREQLAWCKEEGVPKMIVTNCGSEIVGAEKRVRAQLDALARESGVDIELAYDGMEVSMQA